jgi:hypothetical protein
LLLKNFCFIKLTARTIIPRAVKGIETFGSESKSKLNCEPSSILELIPDTKLTEINIDGATPKIFERNIFLSFILNNIGINVPTCEGIPGTNLKNNK